MIYQFTLITYNGVNKYLMSMANETNLLQFKLFQIKFF